MEKNILRRDGYTKASFQVDRHADDKKHTVDLSIRPELGPQYIFGKLGIEGLDINGEAAVKKIWTMKEGKPFNADYPDYFLEQIRGQGLFDDLGKTRSSTKVDEQSHTVDVTLYFGASTESGEGRPATSRRRRR